MAYHASKLVTFAVLALVGATLFGCATSGQQMRAVSSVYEYLYPNQEGVVDAPGVPVLKPPVRVGIAFVPEAQPRRRGYNFWTGEYNRESFSENSKQQLLERIADHFRGKPSVGTIEIIPTAYLTPGGSFANLKQLRTMYGIDVIALVAYDQVQFTDEGALSFAYWTIVGAYVVEGEKNETNTMVDTVVYDIESRKMLFRAPGTSQVKSSATPINLSEELRHNSTLGMQQATERMIVALDQQLVSFADKVKQSPEEYQVVHKGGGGGSGGFGGGALGLESLGLLALLLVGRARRRASGA